MVRRKVGYQETCQWTIAKMRQEITPPCPKIVVEQVGRAPEAETKRRENIHQK